jgi:DNA-binding PadR family transcriptional regulator
MFGGPPRRAERGEVRYLILDALSERGRHGYEIIQTIEERSGGAYRPSPGTVYPTLQMLEELGHVRSVEREGRKIYELTEDGQAELEAHREDVEDAYERFAGGPAWDEMPEFHEAWHRIHRMIRTMASAFRRDALSPRKWRDIQKVITEAAERIEAILKN